MGLLDDIIYVSILIASLFIGYFSKHIENRSRKQWIFALVGVTVIVIVTGWDILHSLLTVCITAFIIKFSGPRHCHILSFIWCFLYIAFFRMTHLLGLPRVAAHSNAVQLLLTLKLVGLAFEVHDTHKLRLSSKVADSSGDDHHKVKLQCLYQTVTPTVVDIFLYSYCIIGLFTGPYYKYRTYSDMFAWNNAATEHWKWEAIRVRAVKLPFYIGAFLILFMFIDAKSVTTDEFLEQPFWYRLGYSVPVFIEMRLRFYIAWLLSECVCIVANLGAYPECSIPRCGQGPTNLNQLHEYNIATGKGAGAMVFNYRTIQCIDEYGCELAPTVREGMRSWNMTVQYWLSQNVFKRLTHWTSFWRMAATMTVSAFWHGVHPGYYLSFLTMPAVVLAEDLLIQVFKKDASPRQQAVFDWFSWFFKLRSFEYTAMGFLLLTFTDTVRYWTSIYFICHVYVVLFIVIALLGQKWRKAPRVSNDSGVKNKVS